MSLAQQVEAYVAVFPDGGAVTANELLHLGERGAVEAALAELTEQEKAYHIEDGIYIRPGDGYTSRFPRPEHILAALTKYRGELFSPSAGSMGQGSHKSGSGDSMAGDRYLTSGQSRWLRVGHQRIELIHAEEAEIRALHSALEKLRPRVPDKAECIEGLRELEPELRRIGVQALWLFGSLVRGDASPDSDIDIAIDVDKTRVTGWDYFAIWQETQRVIERYLQIDCDVVEIESARDIIKTHILKDGMQVF